MLIISIIAAGLLGTALAYGMTKDTENCRKANG